MSGVIQRLVILLVVGGVFAGCGVPERQWYKPGVDYTVADFQRDRAACEKKGEVDEECLRQRGWLPLSADKEKPVNLAPQTPRGNTGPGISTGVTTGGGPGRY